MTATVTVWPHFRRVKHPPGTLVISTTHRDCVDLSPFALGPVKLWGKYSSMNMENAWQFSKVYPEAGHWRNGRPSFVWFMWAKRGWADQRAHRYPMGKGAIPAGSWWDGELLGYIEARKAIYAPLYAELVQRTPTFKRLVKDDLDRCVEQPIEDEGMTMGWILLGIILTAATKNAIWIWVGLACWLLFDS